MTKHKTFSTRFATMLAGLLGISLAVCANTASTCVIHQPTTPKGLEKFSKLR